MRTEEEMKEHMKMMSDRGVQSRREIQSGRIKTITEMHKRGYSNAKIGRRTRNLHLHCPRVETKRT